MSVEKEITTIKYVVIRIMAKDKTYRYHVVDTGPEFITVITDICRGTEVMLIAVYDDRELAFKDLKVFSGNKTDTTIESKGVGGSTVESKVGDLVWELYLYKDANVQRTHLLATKSNHLDTLGCNQPPTIRLVGRYTNYEEALKEKKGLDLRRKSF